MDDTPRGTDPKRPQHLECGCVVTPATGVYDVLCPDHRWLKDDPDMKRFTAAAKEGAARG